MDYTQKERNSFTYGQRATDKYKNLGLKLTFQDDTAPGFKFPSVKINMYNLDPKDAAEIEKRITALPKSNTAKVYPDRFDKSRLMFKVYQDRIDAWLDGEDFKIVQDVLKKSGKYDPESLKTMEDEIAIGAQSKNTKENLEDVKNSADSAIDMWQQYLSNIDDPKVIAQLNLYRKMYGNLNDYGILLSIDNVDLIRRKMPDATFVTTAWHWRTHFNRLVKRGAKPLPYWSLSPYKDATSDNIEAIKAYSAWAGEPYVSIPGKLGLKLQANRSLNKEKKFLVLAIGYDISDTYLIPGMKDIWEEEAGLLNNLNGEMNQLAKDHEEKVKGETNYNPEDEEIQRVATVAENLRNNAKNYGITAVDTGNPSRDVYSMIYEYCVNNASKDANILKPENARIYAENATRVALIISKLGLVGLNHQTSAPHTYTKEEATALMPIVYKIIKMISKVDANTAQINEAFNRVISALSSKAEFVRQFIAALKQIGCKIISKPATPQNGAEPSTETNSEAGMIKENFFKVFNKIDKQLF